MEKNAVASSDGIGLGCFQEILPSKGRILKNGILDIKVFFSCADVRAKSHL